MLSVAAVSVGLTALVLLAIASLTSREQQRIDRFGNAAAEALAELAVEPLMRQDRMHLGVIGNRLAELDEIAGVASYTSDNQLLTTTGELQGPQYTKPVTIDDSIVGYVRVALQAEAFADAGSARTGLLLGALLLLPLLIAGAWSLIRSARSGVFSQALSGALPAAPGWWPRRPDADPVAEPIVELEDPEVVDIRHYLLAVNLYNQLSLPVSEREFELSLCLELAEAVAAVYHGQVVALPGVGVLVDFDHSEEPDRPFQVLCAAFVLARLLNDEAPFGTYRLGLNLAERPADDTLPLDHEAVADAALLSALAKDVSVTISSTFAAVLEHEDRLITRTLVNPLLDQLATSGTGCHLVTELQPPFAALVLQQAEQLKTQRDVVSSPSTF